ncbi:hypothetical protein ACFOEK_04410 [Litoribrevibacter euphylliae]|uniref:Uncharacterized protein n=1 Tax=Litoribrevibacter euphylliae TaxID=1834034 RepID=A0ABV7HDS9_9GAMM
MTDSKQPSEEFDVSALYQQGATEQPPESLDHLILAQAKQELAETQIPHDRKPSQVSRLRKWQWPLSAAAVVVISSSIILDLHQQQKLEVKFDSEAPFEELESFETFESSEEFAPLNDMAPAEKMMKKEAADMEAYQSKPSLSDSVEMESDAFETEHAPASVPAMSIQQFSAPQRLDRHDAMEERKSVETELLERELKAKPRAVESQRLMSRERADTFSGAGAVSAVESDDEQSKPDLLSAEAWISNIDALIEKGEDQQAKEEIVKLKQAYPDYELPERFNALIEP